MKYLLTLLMLLVFVSPDKGAYCSLFAATSPVFRKDPATWEAVYIEPNMTVKPQPTPSAESCDESLARELWRTTVELLTELEVWEGDNLPTKPQVATAA